MTDKSVALINNIVELISDDIDYPLDNTLLLAEVDEGMIAPSIFKDMGECILYRRPDLDSLSDALLELWRCEEFERKRWAKIELLIKDGKFETNFIYPEEFDLEESMIELRTQAVHRYFGRKPVYYPQDNGELLRTFD